MMIITNNVFHQIIVNPMAEQTQIGVKFNIHHINRGHLFLRVQINRWAPLWRLTPFN